MNTRAACNDHLEVALKSGVPKPRNILCTANHEPNSEASVT